MKSVLTQIKKKKGLRHFQSFRKFLMRYNLNDFYKTEIRKKKGLRNFQSFRKFLMRYNLNDFYKTE